jgi:hypothetical protein
MIGSIPWSRTVAVGISFVDITTTTNIEAAELLLLSFLVVVGEVVGLGRADVNAARAGSAAGHDHGATTVGIGLVLLRNLHLVAAGDQLRRCVLASRGGSWVEEVRLGVWSC